MSSRLRAYTRYPGTLDLLYNFLSRIEGRGGGSYFNLGGQEIGVFPHYVTAIH